MIHTRIEMNSKTALLGGGTVLLLIGTFAGYLYGVNSTSVTITTTVATTTILTTVSTVSTVPDTYDQIASIYAGQLLLLDAKNASALVNRYEGNATIDWKGLAGGCEGNYTGSKSISQLLGGLLNNADYFLVSNETQKMGTEGNRWVVNSTFDVAGHGNGSKPFAGNFEITIAAQDSYFHVGNTWLIASETWNFLDFEGSFFNGPPIETC
jgi:hypothetical protein